MAISDRLTKLSEDITSAYKSINDLGGTIPAHKNTENISVAIDSIYNRLPKVSGTGSDITLTPTLKGRLGSVLKGDTLQDGTPTPDSPVAIQCAEGIQNITVDDGNGNSQTQEVDLIGKNLFDKDKVIQNTYINASNGQEVSYIGFFASDYIEISSNTTYYWNDTRFRNHTGAFYDSNKIYISGINTNLTNVYYFTTPSNAKYVRLNGDISNIDNYQLEKGSTSTTYEPYYNYKLYSGDKFIGYPDNWSVYREDIINVLNENSTNISDYVNTGLTNVYGFSASITGMNNITSNGAGLCNILSEIKWQYNYDAESYYLASDTFVFKINKTTIDSQTGSTVLAKLKSYLANTNIELYGKLATPTTTPITDTNLISQLNALYNLQSYDDTTNISVEGNLPMIIEASALKGE